jgi:hypothetical protein
MVRHDDAAVRLGRLSENDVTTPLPVLLLVTDLPQSLEGFAA